MNPCILINKIKIVIIFSIFDNEMFWFSKHHNYDCHFFMFLAVKTKPSLPKNLDVFGQQRMEECGKEIMECFSRPINQLSLVVNISPVFGLITTRPSFLPFTLFA